MSTIATEARGSVRVLAGSMMPSSQSRAVA